MTSSAISPKKKRPTQRTKPCPWRGGCVYRAIGESGAGGRIECPLPFPFAAIDLPTPRLSVVLIVLSSTRGPRGARRPGEDIRAHRGPAVGILNRSPA